MKTIFYYCLIALALSGATQSISTIIPVDTGIEVNTAIRQLDRHITILEQFNTKNKQLKLLPYKAGNRFIFIDEVIDVSHDLLRICIKKMLVDESLDPLFVIWKLFITEYKDIDSAVFLQELSVLLFSIYKNIFLAYLNNRTTVSPEIDVALLQEMIDLYQKVRSLPIKEILYVLDRCLEQFIEIMHDYGMDNDTSWIDWLKKYWWIPPVVATSVFISLLQVLAPTDYGLSY